MIAHACLAWTGIADLDVFQDQHFGPAGFCKSNRFGHESPLEVGPRETAGVNSARLAQPVRRAERELCL
jgi:hypothetical protein